MEADAPPDESARLGALYALELLDQGSNACFDRVTRLAARLFDVPIALVSLVDADRQWFGSRVGLGATETPRCDAFCSHAILGDDVFVVPDASVDRRFRANPLVVGPPDIRFYAGAPISSPDGHHLGTLCIIDTEPRAMSADETAALRDLADLVDRELLVIGMALTDELTGLGNRRAFAQASSSLLDLARRRQEPITLLYADIDGLKGVNDRLGHSAGDALIRRAGSVLKDAVRSSDVVARVGGDEFAVLMFGTDDCGAWAVEQHIHDAIRRHNELGSHEVPLALSVGFAQAGPHDTIDSLAERADQAMYDAKCAPARTRRGP